MYNTNTPRNWKVGVMSDFLKEVSAASLRECKMAGIKCIELFLAGSWIDTSAESIVKKYSKDVENIKKSALDMWSVHLPFGIAWDISAQDEGIRGDIVKKHFYLIEQAARWGAKIATIHASWEPIKALERPERMLYAKESIRAIAQKARECNMRLAVECLPRTCLGKNSEELLQLTMCENAFICMDSNHLFCETHQSFIRKAGHKIITLHISDNDGLDERHWIPGKGIINWREVVHELVEAGYEGPFLFEVDRKYKSKNYSVNDLMSFWNHFCDEFERIS